MSSGKLLFKANSSKRVSCTKLARLPLAIMVALYGSAHAELKLLDDESMSDVTGKAGLTIDIETQVSIAEVEYVDAGSLYWSDYSLTGIGGGLVDNIRATVDVAGDEELLHTGFSDLAMLADAGYFDTVDTDIAWAITEYGDGNGNFGKTYGDGDLVIHVTPGDFGFDLTTPPSPLDYDDNMAAYKNAIDLHMQQGDFGLRSSDGLTETSLTRNFSVQAYLGYLDIILRNNGNGFHDTATNYREGKPQNIWLADSAIEIDAKFRVEDLDVDSTNNATNTIVPRSVTNPYLYLRDMRIHNARGHDTLGSFGFASVQYKIAAAKNIIQDVNLLAENGANLAPANFKDGMAWYDINVKWDWDLPHIAFGPGEQSIGSVFFTDMQIMNSSLTFSAH